MSAPVLGVWALDNEASSLRDASGPRTKTTVESASLSVALGSMTVVCNMPSTGRMVRGSKMWQ
jgi:dihydroorotase-like cyclic amidohydrolase